MQFSQWNRKSFIDNRWEVFWIALSMTIWKHRNVLDLKSIFQQQHNNCFNDNLKWRVGTGSNISLRNDLWLQDNCNIQRKYPQLYVISKQQNFLINSMGEFVDGRWEWKLSWRRDFFDYEIQMAADFVEEIHSGHIHLICNCTMTRRLWWEPLRWVNRVGPFSTDPKNHFLQFTQWNNKASINNRWKFLWLALSFFVWHHRNAMIFKNQPFDPEKHLDDAMLLLWSWLKSNEKDFTLHFNQCSSNVTLGQKHLSGWRGREVNVQWDGLRLSTTCWILYPDDAKAQAVHSTEAMEPDRGAHQD
ncbi:hypothetical protein GmHk_12G034847 [Glycine max]|nr:hypothetical protein GmHk_12G034847 [Glycine max]